MLPPAPVTSTTLSGDEGADRVLVELHGLAAEQVLDGDVADLGDVDPPAEDLVEAGDDLDLSSAVLGQLHDPADRPGRARWPW